MPGMAHTLPKKLGTAAGDTYCLGRKLGAGSFGDIYFAVHAGSGKEVAVKLESVKSKHPMLLHEAKLLKQLEGAPGFATMHYCDTVEDHNVMVVDLLGPSLEDLFNLCKRIFSLKTMFDVGRSVVVQDRISPLQGVHSPRHQAG